MDPQASASRQAASRRAPTGGSSPKVSRAPWTTASFLPVFAMPLLLLLNPSLTGCFYIDERQSPRQHEWSYDQTSWPQSYRACGSRAQSPIDIQAKNVILSNHLRLQFYNYNRQFKFKLSNAHHTIKLNPLGWAYQDAEVAPTGHGGGAGGGSNYRHNQINHNRSTSSIHDMLTADEYVEFASPALIKATQGGGDANNEQADTNAKLVAQSAHGNLDPHLSTQQLQQQQQRPGSRLSPTTNGQKSSQQAAGSQRPGQQQAQSRHQPAAAATNEIQLDESLPPPSELAELPYGGAPTIKLDWLDDGNNEYKLRDIHFHWGERRDNGSEHAIDGRRAAMEMHLVHIKHGLDKSMVSFTSDSVAVIAILIESHRKSNADFNPIVNLLSRINMTDEPEEIEYKSINDLLPSNLNSFYYYSGSLTTPPCYEVVNWIVMNERLNMNAKQIEMFRNLYAPSQEADGAPEHQDNPSPPHPHHQHHHRISSHRGEEAEATTTASGNQDDTSGGGVYHQQLIMPNIRSLQPLNNRTILFSGLSSGSTRWTSVLSSGGSSSFKTITNSQSSVIMMLLCAIWTLAFIRQIVMLDGNVLVITNHY